MWLARYFPGLQLRIEDVDQMTPEETDQLRKVGRRFLKDELDERVEFTKVICRAAASGGIRL